MKLTSFILFSEPGDEIFSPQNLLLKKIYCKNLKSEMGPPLLKIHHPLDNVSPGAKVTRRGDPFS